MNITLKKLGNARTEATIVLDDALVKSAQEEAIKTLSKDIEIKGFRPGQAPLEELKDKVPQQRVHEEVVRTHMPDIMKELVENQKLVPIIRPRVELKELSPFTVVIVIVEKPTVKVQWKKVKLPKEKEEKKSKESKEPPSSAKASEGKKEESEEEKMKRDEVQRQEEANREQKLFEILAEHTIMEVAPELIEDEVQGFLQQHIERLKQYGMEFDQWLNQVGKSFEDFLKEIRPEAEKRLKVRFGVSWLMDEWKVEVPEEEMKEAIEIFLKPLKDEERSKVEEAYKPGERAYEQFKYQQMVEKVFERLRGQSKG
jgi:FKBP-type peptidyl-prolyl cis-trans isomerase (trigger factor)